MIIDNHFHRIISNFGYRLRALEQTSHIIFEFLKEKNFRVLKDLGNGNVLFERY